MSVVAKRVINIDQLKLEHFQEGEKGRVYGLGPELDYYQGEI